MFLFLIYLRKVFGFPENIKKSGRKLRKSPSAITVKSLVLI